MAAALWAHIDELVPEAKGEGLQVRISRVSLELAGRISIGRASLLNVAAHEFRKDHPSCEISRAQLEIFVPKVRLGDVATEQERRVLAMHTKSQAYLDPDSRVDAPEWNPDFVTASDRRHRAHIKPRYAKDDERTLDAIAAFIADFCHLRGGIVVHTGAGISAAAGIATYREGGVGGNTSISAALPTYSHFAIVVMRKIGGVDYVCSQNVDGLHRRSGLPADRLSELHGNSYIETCSCCSPPREFVRPFDVYSTSCDRPQFFAQRVRAPDGRVLIEANVELTPNERSSGIPHVTGRACPRGGGPLRDSIIHFGESLPRQALAEGMRRSTAAPLNLVVGSSLLVQPAASLPFAGRGPAAIVSLTCTGHDVEALRCGGVLLHCEADAALERILRHVGGARFPNEPSLMEQLHARVRARDQALLRADGDEPYDGGADGGVVPDEFVRQLLVAPVPVEP